MLVDASRGAVCRLGANIANIANNYLELIINIIYVDALLACRIRNLSCYCICAPLAGAFANKIPRDALEPCKHIKARSGRGKLHLLSFTYASFFRCYMKNSVKAPSLIPLFLFLQIMQFLQIIIMSELRSLPRKAMLDGL